MFGFKAYAIVIYFVLLAALSQLLNATFITSLNYNEIKLVPQSGIEPTSPAYKTGPHPLKVSGANLAGTMCQNIRWRIQESNLLIMFAVNIQTEYFPQPCGKYPP